MRPVTVYSIEFTKRARRQVLKLDPRLQERVEAAVDSLVHWPVEGKSVRPLKGQLEGLYRMRVGDYRVILAVDEERGIISVREIGHRGSIYR
jgi:mRNA interferase RelE/StbE